MNRGLYMLWLILGCSSNDTEKKENHLTVPSYEECFPHLVEHFDGIYEDFSTAELAPECSGTKSQNHSNIEHVVFLGDSVTVGTYPTEVDGFYRTLLTEKLADYYNLELPEKDWFEVDYDTGRTKIQRSGDFSSCAKLGSKTRDLVSGNQQLENCFTDDVRNKNILVVMTLGGNDLADVAQGIASGWSEEALWDKGRETVRDLEKGISWLRDEERFPTPLNIVFGNVYEFTDATGDTTACPLAGLAGLDVDIDDPILEDITIWVSNEYYKISQNYGTDMMFLLENFCGHGFHHDNPDSRCYLGPEAELWFDNTCLHPNPTGHQVISDLFFEVIKG